MQVSHADLRVLPRRIMNYLALHHGSHHATPDAVEDVLMSAVTLSPSKGYAAEAAAPKKGFLGRLYAAILAAQAARAERELAFYIQRTGDDPRK
ncbi:hypothetical protein ABLE91_11305 [Aquabacter sp. CN5-332]|uniref:hypothetical protein n=1 Tax=Aquabacter sp. CN5-332 TaxID=3156608 RepID=UPI0032B376B7